jgi:hypothetical protein
VTVIANGLFKIAVMTRNIGVLVPSVVHRDPQASLHRGSVPLLFYSVRPSVYIGKRYE